MREIAILGVLLMLATSTALAESPEGPRQSHDTTIQSAIHSCPVSLPNLNESPNDYYISTRSGYGNAERTMFIGLWPGGKVFFSPHGSGRIAPDGSLGMKFWFYRTIPGEVIIGGRRLDAPAPPMPEVILRGVPDGYGKVGFHPAGIIFPDEGCWEVTARIGDSRLTFVTLVAKIPFDPVFPAWLPEELIHLDTDLADFPKSIRFVYGSPVKNEGELIIETTQGVKTSRKHPPADNRQPVLIQGERVCMKGGQDERGAWKREANAGTLVWTIDGFRIRFSHVGLGLSCADLMLVAVGIPD